MSNVSTVKSIGRADRKTEDTAAEIIAATDPAYDWTARGAIPKAILAWAVADGSKAPAQFTGPKGAQVPTDFGRGVDRLRKAVKALLSEDSSSSDPDYLARVVKAALAANKHEVSGDVILSAVAAALAEQATNAA